MSKVSLPRGGELQPVSARDLAFLALTFLVVCTIFALESGLSLPLGHGAGAAIAAGTGAVTIAARPGGRFEIDGRPASLDMVRPAVERALAADDRAVVTVERGAGTTYGQMLELLDEVRSARAPRVIMRDRSR